MISRRSKWLLLGTALLPSAVAIDLILHFLHDNWYAQWEFIEPFTPYAFTFVLVIFTGLLFMITSVLSILLDLRHHLRGNARNG